MTTEALLGSARSLPNGSESKALLIVESIVESIVEFLVAEVSKNLFTLQCCRQRQAFHPACCRQPVLTRTTQPNHKPALWRPLRDSTARLNDQQTASGCALFSEQAYGERTVSHQLVRGLTGSSKRHRNPLPVNPHGVPRFTFQLKARTVIDKCCGLTDCHLLLSRFVAAYWSEAKKIPP